MFPGIDGLEILVQQRFQEIYHFSVKFYLDVWKSIYQFYKGGKNLGAAGFGGVSRGVKSIDFMAKIN